MSGNGNLIGGIVGGIIGFVVSGYNPYGAVQGYMIGAGIGGVLMPGKLPGITGPRLEDLRVQSSEYGRPIPIVYGTIGVQGNVIDSYDLIEVETTTEQGGKGGPSQTVTEFSYYGKFAVLVCEGEANVLRIWAGPEKRLIYDGFLLEGGGSVRIYTGTETQMPDPMLEQLHGTGNVPAYRGWCYVVFEDFPLANDGNRLPFLTFEVSTGTGGIGTNYIEIEGARLYDPAPLHVHTHSGAIGRGSAQDPTDGMLYVVRDEGDYCYLDKLDPVNGGLVASLECGSSAGTKILAVNPVERSAVVLAKNDDEYYLVDLDAWTATLTLTEHSFAKTDVIYSPATRAYHWLNKGNQQVDGMPHGDNWGRTGVVSGGYLIDCSGEIAAVSSTQPTTYGGASISVNAAFEVFDPVAMRLISFADDCYYDFNSGLLVALDSPLAYGVVNPVYNPYIRRIVAKLSDNSVVTYDPSQFSASGFPIEATLFEGALLYSEDPEDLVLRHSSLMPVVLPTMPSKMAFVDQTLFTATAGDIFVMSIGTTAQGMVLGDIVADLCERAGLTDSEYDVSELTDIVDGYAIAKQTDCRSAIDALRPAYYFDAVESPGVVRFVKRGSGTVTTIPDEDLGAHMAGSEPAEPLKTVRRQEVELPRTVNVSYLLAATDYSTATKTAKRLTGSSQDIVDLQMPLVLSDTKAQEVAEVNLHAAWAQRLSYEFTLPRKYAELEPTDLVLVKGNLMRLMRIVDTPFGIRKCEAVSDDAHYYSPHVVVTETPPSDKTVYVPGETILMLM